MSSGVRAFRLVLVAGCAAGVIALSWFMAQQQIELGDARVQAAIPDQISITVTPALGSGQLAVGQVCERVANHASRPAALEIDFPGATPSTTWVPARGSELVCFAAGGYSIGP